jgi:E3 ubiquitin-protein ligase TRIP12
MDLDRETDSRLQQNITNTGQPIRSSARVRAAKEKEQQKLIQQNTSEHTSTEGKAKANQDKRCGGAVDFAWLGADGRLCSSRRSAATPLTIHEPIRDPKGKKRAAPVDSDTEEPPAKRQKTRNNRKKTSRKSNIQANMSTSAK